MELVPLAVTILFPIYSFWNAHRNLGPEETLLKKMVSPTHNWYEQGGPPKKPNQAVTEIVEAPADADAPPKVVYDLNNGAGGSGVDRKYVDSESGSNGHSNQFFIHVLDLQKVVLLQHLIN